MLHWAAHLGWGPGPCPHGRFLTAWALEAQVGSEGLRLIPDKLLG